MRAVDVSIIVAAYNAERTIERCLDSILKQTHTSFEIIVVDDGSADNTPALLRAYGARDDRVRAITQKNSGPAAARAAALPEVRGAYIAFVDADDAVETCFLEKLYAAAARENADLAVCAHTRIKGGESVIYSMTEEAFSIALMGREAFHFAKLTKLGHTIWGRLYRADLIRDNHLTFMNTRYAEDLVFNLFVYCYADKVVTISDALYNYYITPGSIMADVPADIVPRMLEAAEGYDAFLTERGKRADVGLYADGVWLQKAYDLLNMVSRGGLSGIRACLNELDASPVLGAHIAGLRGKAPDKKTALKRRLFVLRPKWLRALFIWQCMKLLLSKSLR